MNYFELILSNKSILRILQFQEFKKKRVFGEVIEFGANEKLEKNFIYSKNKEINATYSNIVTSNNKFIKIDLQKKIKIKKKFDYVIIFNVLEHLSKPEIALKNIRNILKKNGCIIGSTPFLFRVHGAPKDYYRFTHDYLKLTLKKSGFKNIKINALGTGPFLASISILRSYLKFIPIVFQCLILISVIFDKILSIFIKTNPKKIYPIGYFFLSYKK